MNENNEKLLKQAKSFTLILAIFYTLYSFIESLASIFVIIASSIDWVEQGMSVEEAAEMSEALSTSAVYITYILTIAYIVLTVFLYISNSKLKKGKAVSKLPYFFVVAVQLYSIFSELLSSPIRIWSLFVNVAIAVLAIMIILNLYKLEPENSAL